MRPPATAIAALSAEEPKTPGAGRGAKTRPHVVPVAVASALLMEFIDSTALSTALPSLARALATDPIHLKLALTSYILALAVFAPASGWVADRYGARRVFMIAMLVFLAGSGLCALANSLPGLVAARVVQGIGGAMMTPVGRIIVAGTTRKEHLMTGVAWFTTPALIGPLLGPPIAGLILELASWRWIFLVNLPVGVLGLIAVWRLVPPLAASDPGRFDTLGFVLCATAIVSLAATAETVGLGLLPAWVQMTGAAIAAAMLVAFVVHARRCPHPVLDLSLLRYQSFRVSLIGGTIFRLGLGALPFLLPLLLQIGLGWPAGRAGMIMIAVGAGALSARALGNLLVHRIGFRSMLIATSVGVAALATLPGFVTDQTPVTAIVVLLGLIGAMGALQFTAANTLVYADVPDQRASAVTTFTSVVQQVGMSLGVTMGALSLHLARPESGKIVAASFTWPFMAVAGATLLAAPVYFRLPGSAGAQISGRPVPDDAVLRPHSR